MFLLTDAAMGDLQEQNALEIESSVCMAFCFDGQLCRIVHVNSGVIKGWNSLYQSEPKCVNISDLFLI